jgi:tetratricopeptide (TPR) repeat protein
MTFDETIATLRQRAADLAAALDAPDADAVQLKHRIYLLHRAVEEQMLALEGVQHDVKELVDGWKTRFRTPQPDGRGEPPSVDPTPGLLTPPEAVTPVASSPVASSPTPAAPVDDFARAANRVLERTPLLSIAVPSPVIAMASVPAERPPAIVAAAAPRPGQPRVVDELNASTFVDRGWSRLAAGDYVAAEVALRKALELNPTDAYAAVLLAWAEVAQDRSDDALARLVDVLEAVPTLALGHVVAGHAHLREERFEPARAHLAQAIALDNDRKASLYAWYYKGQLHLARAAWDDAITAFARALEYGPNLIEARYETGHAHWGAGRADAAREAWRLGAEANKFNPWSKRCREMLAVLDAGGTPERAG